MGTKKVSGRYSQALGKSLRILVVMAMLLSSIPTRFTLVNAATTEKVQVEPGLSIKDSSLDDEGTVDVTAQDEEGGDTAEEPTEEPIVEPTEEIAQEPTELPTEPPVEEPTEEPVEDPAEEPTEEPTATPETEPTQAPVCYALTLSHSGEGSDLLAEPAFSEGCAEGAYVEGEVISLSGALPDENWEISGWTGTEDDTSTADSNTLIMPAEERAVSVVYSEIMLMALSEEEEEVEAQTTYNWVAYNDCVTTSSQHQGSNVTSIGLSEDGVLLDQTTGSETGVTVDISGSSATEETSTGDDTNEGTDAYNTFFDYVDMAGVIRYSTSGWYVDVTFTNLDTSKTYTFATSANRANSSYDTRNSKFTISDIASAINESTDGATISTTDLADDTTVFCTGYNTVNGYVARWTGITPGSDGDFTVRFESNSSSAYQAYGPSVFLLAEEVSDTPAISTSASSLSDFNSAVGLTSAEQSYTVTGTNLTDDLVVTAPDDFEVSTISGSGFDSSVSLTPLGGSVSETIYVRLNPASATTYSGLNIAHTSTSAAEIDVAVSGSSVPAIAVTNEMTAFSSAVGIASEEQSYTVSAVNLTDNLVISAPTNFEIADTSGGSFGASLSLIPVDGAVSDTLIYVRFNASAAGTYSEEISHTATGATTKSAAVSGTAGDPTISVAGTLSAFSSSAGTASDEQSYTVSGSFLSSDITITAPANFYISTTSGSGFDSTLILTPANGTVAETPIYVNFLKATVGTSSGNITHTGGGAAQVNLAVSGTATSAPLCTTANLPVTADTYMNSGSTKGSYNYGGAETIQLNPYYSGGTSNQYRAPLLLWDLSSIPEDASITDASLSFYVTTGETAYTYSLYNMRRSWVEGSNDGVAGSGASWNYYDAGSTSWGTAGAANTSTDRYNTNLWDAAKTDFGNTGSTTFDLNESGVEVIQGWLDGSLTNYGLTIQNYSGTAAGSWIAASSDNTSGYAVPTLNVTYCIPVTGPTITVTGSLSAFNAEPGIPSVAQTYTVSGASLTDDISINAPSGFELSTDGTNYYALLALTQSDGSVAETTVYVRMSSATEGDFSGNIEHTSSGASQIDLAVSGTVAITPTTIIFQDGLNDYTGTRDTYIYDSSPDTVRGTETTIVQDINASDERRSLLLFDLTLIPTGATVTSAELQFYVSAEGQGFNMYRMLKAWDEATISYTSNGGHFDADDGDAESSVNANWPGDDGYTGYITVTVPAETIEDWLDGTLTNNGWLMIATDSDDGQQLVSREGTTQEQKPKLTVEYIPPSTVPTIATFGTLVAFSAQPDEPSEPQTYTVSGSNLTEDIGISAPAGFELSTDDITYSSTLAISQIEGTVEETTVYVRLASSAVEGAFSGNITHASSGATTKNVAVSGEVLYVYTLIVGNDGNGLVTFEPDGGSYSNGTTVTLTPVPNSGFTFDSWSGSSASDVIETEGVYTIVMDGDKTLDANFTSGQTCTTVNLPTSADTWLRSSQATMNYGATTTLQVSNYTSYPQGTLMKWNLSEIPSTATVTGVSLTLNVTDATTYEFYLYDMLRDWVEGTNNGAAGTGASWTYYGAGVNEWGSAGAQNTTSDRNDTNLWDAGVISSSGSQTFDLNSSGLSVVQGWVADSESNNGLTIQNYSGASSADYLKFDSREGTSAPTLNVTYCVGSTVTYTLNLSNDGNGSVTRDPAGPTYDYNTEVTLTPVANTGYEFSTWTGTDASDPVDNGDGTWSLAMDGNKSLTANFTLLPVNVAPDQPVLISPDDDATGVITSPTLEVTVSDANPADTLDVNFYGREAGGSSGEDFTLIVIPDTQNDTTSYPAVFNSQMQWIADNKTPDNIVFATHVGDIVNTASSTSEWTKADTAMSYLDSGDVNYSVGPGNHDINGLYSTYFGSSRFSGKSYYQGYYTSGNDNYNNYSFFSASGMDFIIINLQYGTSSSSGQLAWADALLKANPDRRAIVVQHDILNINNSWYNQASYNALKDNPNLFLMLCGHMHSSSDGAAYVAGTGDDGHTIHVMLADYQDFQNTGYLRILRFSPADDKIYGTTCTPSGSCLTSTSNYDQTELAYDMENGNDAFELIGTVEDVVNGSNASFTWEDLDNSTEYEWYATVSDGTELITGSTWSFTSEAAGTNHAPVLNTIGDQVVDELSPLSFTATAYDSDGNPLSFSLADGASGSVPAGASIGSSSGVFSWTPTEAQGGSSYTFDVCVSDGSLSDCETITVTVIEVNNAPVLDPIGSQSGDELTLLSFTATATDYEGDSITFSLADGTSGSVPSNASIGSASGDFSWQPTEEQGPGTYTFDVCASDGSLDDCETITVTVYESNQAPVLAEISDKSGNELAEMTFTASAVDGDLPANTLTYSLEDGTSGSVPGSASIGTSSGFFSWTPSEAEGPGIYTFDVCVSDGSLEDCQTITLTISELNIYPVLDPIGAQSGNELESISFTATASDSDLPANTLTFSLADGDSGLVPEGAAIDASSGLFSWLPDESQGPDAYTFDVCVSDGSAQDCETITVTVNEVNQAPVLAEITNKSGNELAEMTFTASATDGDLPANTLTFSLEDGTGGSIPAGASIGATSGLFSWTPTEAQGAGVYAFDVCVSDGSLEDCQTITVTVNEVNSDPILNEIGGQGGDELENISFTATASDSDLPANTLTFSLADGDSGLVPEGAAIDASSGLFGWIPNESQGPGVYTFDVCVGDGSAQDCETIIATINEVNAAPVLTPIEDMTVEIEDELSFTALATDEDLPANTLTFSLTGTVPSGAVIGALDGAFSWTPTTEQGTGEYTFSVQVCDDGVVPLCDDHEITVTVTIVNAEPVAVDDSYETAEDTQLNVSAPQGVLDNDSDADENELTAIKVSDPENGDLTLNGDGSFTYMPDGNFNGSDSFTYKANDGIEDSEIATVSITVTAVNDVPVADAQLVGTDEDNAVAITLTGSDIESLLTYGVVDEPQHGDLSGMAPDLTYTPDENYNGSDSFTFKVNDGTVDSNVATISITVTAVNDVPVADAQVVATDEDIAVAITMTGSDADGDTLDYVVVDEPQHGDLSGTVPELTYTPDENYNGSDSFTFKVNDGTVDSNVAAVTIDISAVNDVPVADAQVVATDEDIAVAVTLTSSDADGDTLGYTVVDEPQHGDLSGTVPELTYTPDENYNGSDSFTFKVNDSTVDSNTAAVTITVNEVNDAPVADAQVVATDEDTPIAIMLTGSDVDSSALTYTVMSEPQHGDLSGTAPDLTYTPDENYNGSDVFTFKIDDGDLDSNVATVTIDIAAVNDVPVADAQVVATDEDNAVAVILMGSDVDGDTLGYTVVDEPQHGDLSGMAPDLSYTPDENYNGSDSFTFKVNDSTVDSNTAAVTITVNEVNDAPVADAQVVVTDEDTPIAIMLTGSDVDSSTLTYTVMSEPQHGDLSGTAPDLTYTPDENYSGSDIFTFKIDDGDLDSIVAAVTIDITEVNDAPVADAQEVGTDEDIAVAITLTGSDADGDTLGYTVVDEPQHGDLSGTVPDLTYTPDENYYGSDSFTFKVNDGTVDSNVATVAITIASVNDVPVCSAVSMITSKNTQAQIAPDCVDVEGSLLTYSIADEPANGTGSVVDGLLTYVPGTDYVGADSFTYKANDGEADSNAADATVTVNEENHPPVCAASELVTDEDTQGQAIPDCSDFEGSTLTYNIITQPANGTVGIVEGQLVYEPDENYNGSDSFTYTANDGFDDSEAAEVSVTVNAVNDAPVCADSSLSTNQNTQGSTDPQCTDIENDSLTYSIADQAEYGAASYSLDKLVYLPETDYSGADSFTYMANDGEADSNIGTVNVTVLAEVLTTRAPSTPSLVSPANKSLVTDLTPRMDWGSSRIYSGTVFDHYQVQVATDSDFADLVVDKDIADQGGSEYTLEEELSANTRYYWRVRTFNTFGQYSNWASVRYFREAMLPPDLLQPVNGTYLDNLRPEFDWKDVEGANGYTIQISSRINMGSPTSGKVTDSSYIPTKDLSKNKTLYWRVRAEGENGPSDWSEIFALVTPNTPTTPKLSLPKNKSLVTDAMPRLDWSNSAVPRDVEFDHYQVQIATDEAFMAVVVDKDVVGSNTDSEYTLENALTPNTRYYWRVRAFNTLGQYSSWSTAYYFREAIEAPELVSPINAIYLDNLRPEFDWEDVAGASGYTIQISSRINMGSPTSGKVTDSSYVPTKDLSKNKTLYWRVRAEGENGPSGWSEVRTMVTPNTPSTPKLILPKNRALVTDLMPKLDWSNSVAPNGTFFDHYQVQVATDEDFTAVVVDEEISGQTNSEYTLESVLNTNTRYYWRVRAFNTLGQYGSWSTAYYFREAIEAPELVSPINAVYLDNLRPEFDWEDVEGASGYTIQISSRINMGSSTNAKVTDSSYVPKKDLSKNKTLYWRVRTEGENGPSGWSEIRTMVTPNTPSTPKLSLPKNKALVTDLMPRLDWSNSVAPKNTEFDHYQVQLAMDEAFAVVVVDKDVVGLNTDSEYTLEEELSTNTRYYWRVRAFNTLGQYSSWSTAYYFREAMVAPDLVQPEDGVQAESLRPQFEWEAVEGASSYTIQLSTRSNMRSASSKTVQETQYNPTKNLSKGKTYYWRVRANGENGPSPWSEVKALVTPSS